MQLNPSFVKQIKRALENSNFSLDDYTLEYPQYGELVIIKFNHHPEFTFSVEEEEFKQEVKRVGSNNALATALALNMKEREEFRNEIEVKFVTTERPGKYKSEDKFQLSSLNGVSMRISRWSKHIENELLVIYAEDQELNDTLNQKIEAIFPSEISEPNMRFSTEELIELSKSLNSLYERIENLKSECELSERRLSELKTTLEKAESNAKSFPKGVWLKLNKGKVTKAVKNIFTSPEAREFALEVVKKITLGA
ncbi:hypothetical protein [Vibrio renipiscarius]|uniref:Uncharacterized protein n=1 Tax=Vibrio renipiscarius TaxID=1461322 RepID=A0A0C2JBM1_9VIBR|nr:hypothetical protein [Vibrio renipiscarius]KII75294.1 hypothetical protein OJ16_18530 [Vibrio renipiscarius]KII78746.1 hypothetical protein PL18_10640 [Vibrio renipiscarius]